MVPGWKEHFICLGCLSRMRWNAAEGRRLQCKEAERSKDSKVKAQIFTHLLYRHWNAYREGKRTHLFLVQVRSGILRMATTGIDPIIDDRSRPNTRRLRCAGILARRAGRLRLLAGWEGNLLRLEPRSKPRDSTNNDLFTVPVNCAWDTHLAQILAATKNITAENKASDYTPLYSPDGKYIAYRAQQRPGYESDRFRLMLFDRKTGQKTELTNGFDQWVGTFIWASDSEIIYFSSEHKRHSLIYAVDISQSNGDFYRDRTLR